MKLKMMLACLLFTLCACNTKNNSMNSAPMTDQKDQMPANGGPQGTAGTSPSATPSASP